MVSMGLPAGVVVGQEGQNAHGHVAAGNDREVGDKERHKWPVGLRHPALFRHDGSRGGIPNKLPKLRMHRFVGMRVGKCGTQGLQHLSPVVKNDTPQPTGQNVHLNVAQIFQDDANVHH